MFNRLTLLKINIWLNMNMNFLKLNLLQIYKLKSHPYAVVPKLNAR